MTATTLLWLVPALPLAGFLLLALAGSRLPRAAVAAAGVGSVAAAALAAFALAGAFLSAPPPGGALAVTLWTWVPVHGLVSEVALRLDALSLTMAAVVAPVGFLILLYSVEFMAGDEGYARFFACMDLFVGAMLTLVLAGDLLLLYLGWEGVGLCSYLLIGFRHREAANVRAARKAFIVTRVGDAAFLVGLLLLFANLGTLSIPEVLARAGQSWGPGSGLAVAAAALVLAGALGKSAQLPLQTWLPDAMAGPTPVSALIHAATMVAAGVYLIARMQALFALAPAVQTLVALIGAATLLLASCAALAQRDVKRVLAYSTIAQIGYMFLALGVGAGSAAIFHFVTHACFKALLFLAAGAVILALEGEHDMFRMGGLRRAMPGTFWAFLIGAASLSALPLVTAGFFSKEPILDAAWAASSGGRWLWAAGLLGAFLTSLYSFRMVFLIFCGARRRAPARRMGLFMGVPLAALAALSLAAGVIDLPPGWGHLPRLTEFLGGVLPASTAAAAPDGGGFGGAWRLAAGAVVSLSGIGLAWILFLRQPEIVAAAMRSAAVRGLHRLLAAGWGFDLVYDRLLVRPFVRTAGLLRGDPLGLYARAVAAGGRAANRALASTQTGRLRWYAAAIAIGAVLAILFEVLRVILAWLIAIPLAGGLLAWLGGLRSRSWPRWILLAAMTAELAALAGLWASAPWPIELDREWIPQFGIRFHLAVDGLSLLLMLLTALLGLAAVAASWREVQERTGLFHLGLGGVLAGIVGVFLARDLFLFYFFWELMLVPMYFLIAMWGREERRAAAIKFFVFTQAGGLLMLLAILGLYFFHGRLTGRYTFDSAELLGSPLPAGTAGWLFLGFLLAFAVKLGAVPLHAWLPDAYTQAPTAGSLVLAGLMAKAGAYGLLRFAIPLFPQAAAEFGPALMVLALIGILYGAALAFAQNDLKRVVAWSSVSHMSFVLLGIFAGNALALQGAVVLMLSHGIGTGALFLLAGALEERVGTRDLDRMGGLWSAAPRLGGGLLFFALAAMGLPAFGNFVGEFLILMGTYRVSVPMAAVAAGGTILSVVYALWMVQRAVQGPARGDRPAVADLTGRETAVLAALMAAILWLGLYPRPVIDAAGPALKALQKAPHDRDEDGKGPRP